MHYNNLISTSITQKEINEITAAIDRINNLLPNLIVLSPEEKASLPKVSYKNIDFVYEVLELAEKHPEKIPKSINIEEIRKDIELIESIEKILIPLKRLEKKLEDSALLAGGEAYVPSLAVFNAIRMEQSKQQREKTNIF